MAAPYQSVHTSRTLMLAELKDLMAQALETQDFTKAMEDNATGKRTKVNQSKTHSYLRNLYDLNPRLPRFQALVSFWKMAPESDHRLLALLYAIGKDFLLAESVQLLIGAPMGKKVATEDFRELVLKNHPNRYSLITLQSVAKNLASSWKQAGYLRGMYKNERVRVTPSYYVLTFAMLLAYLNGVRGQFILTSPTVEVLCLSDQQLRELAFEATKRDLMRFQSAGVVTAVSFDHLMEKIGLHEVDQD
jgi:hypothetical protein